MSSNPTSMSPIPRFRTDGSLTKPQPIIQVLTGQGHNESSVFGYASPRGLIRTMQDVITPDFKKRIALGEVIFNPMSTMRQELSSASQGPAISGTTMTLSSGFEGLVYTYNGDFLPYFVDSRCDAFSTEVPEKLIPPWLEKLPVDRAVAEATTKALRPPSKANLLVSLAELDKTYRLVPDLLHNWSNLFKKLNRVSVKTRHKSEMANAKGLSLSNLRALERSLTETWLAMRFGVRPLVMDTLGVIEAIKAEYDAQSVRITQRGNSTATAYEEHIDTQNLGVLQIQTQVSTQNTVFVRAMSLWETRLEMIRNMGVSIANIPEAVVDLQRFSFVLNWVVNVNDFFASLGALADPGLRNLGGCYVLEQSRTRTWQVLTTNSISPYWAVTRPATGITTSTIVERSRMVGLMYPKLVVRANPSKFLTDLRLVDAVALLRQQTRGRNIAVLLGKK